MSEVEALAAAVALLAPTDANPMTLQDAKDATAAELGNYYTEVMVSPIYTDRRRVSAQTSVAGWLISTRAVGTTEDAARKVREFASAALEDARLTVDGAATTPIKFESATDVGEDDNWWSGLTTWTCWNRRRRTP